MQPTSQIEQLDEFLTHAGNEYTMIMIPAQRIGSLGQAKEIYSFFGQSTVYIPYGYAGIRTMSVVTNGQNVGVHLVPCQAGAHALLTWSCK